MAFTSRMWLIGLTRVNFEANMRSVFLQLVWENVELVEQLD